jgi:hypothetical protein
LPFDLVKIFALWVLLYRAAGLEQLPKVLNGAGLVLTWIFDLCSVFNSNHLFSRAYLYWSANLPELPAYRMNAFPKRSFNIGLKNRKVSKSEHWRNAGLCI